MFQNLYDKGATAEQGDFSERLMKLVDDIVQRKGLMSDILGTSKITQLVYSHDIHALSNALSDYLVKSGKEGVWLLFDNLDKGWPVQAATQEDILLLQSLLEATWKLQRQMRQREVEFHVVVFIRNDIYQHLLVGSSDRGKDTAVLLDWDDPEVFKEIIRRRVIQSTGLDERFEDLWLKFFESHVQGEESFGYILRHTQMRPREVIRFVRDCINVAVNRGHEKVSEADFIQAEASYSEDAFKDISLELSDVRPSFTNAPYAFIGSKSIMSKTEVSTRLLQINVDADEQGRILDLLLWFSFLGVHVYPDEERYSYDFKYDLKRMRSGLPSQFGYSIHPAFRTALGCT